MTERKGLWVKWAEIIITFPALSWLDSLYQEFRRPSELISVNLFRISQEEQKEADGGRDSSAPLLPRHWSGLRCSGTREKELQFYKLLVTFKLSSVWLEVQHSRRCGEKVVWETCMKRNSHSSLENVKGPKYLRLSEKNEHFSIHCWL